jgi:hypothetical protein
MTNMPPNGSNQGPYDFHHFDTDYDCYRFMRDNPHIQVIYMCCGGKGFATTPVVKKTRDVNGVPIPAIKLNSF